MTDPVLLRAREAFEKRHFAEAHRLASSIEGADSLEVKAAAEEAMGDPRAAEATLRRAIAIAPDRHWPYGHLTQLLLGAGRTKDAETVVRQALASDDANAGAHAMLGRMLCDREALVPGTWHLERAIALAGRHPHLLGTLGRNLARQGKLEEAEPLLREAAAAMPDEFLPLAHLAELLEQADRLDEAAATLARAKPLAARVGQDVTLQGARLLARTERWRQALTLLDTEPTLSGSALLARGRLRDRAGRHGAAWADFTAGKAILGRDHGRSYPRAAVEELEHVATGFLSSARFAAMPRAGVRRDVPQPVFVLGFPRSGTTLTEQVLTSHSAIRPGGELPFTPDLADFAAALTGGRFPTGLGALMAADKRYLPALFRDFYLDRAAAQGLLDPGASFFTDKMPLNELYLPLLRLAFPEAPLIRVERHPLDVMVSAMAHDLTHGFNCGYRLEDAAHHFATVDRLAAYYGEALGIAPHILRYEALIADQVGETAALMAYLGLEMEPAQLRFHESRRHAPTPSYAQVREPLNDRSIGRWRHYEAELAAARPVLAPAIARGGYAA